MSTTVLLAGGYGMLGRAMQRAFLELRPDWNILSPRRAALDLADNAQTRAFFENHDIDLVVNCAGKVGGIASNISDPVGYLYENVVINGNLIHEAHKAGVPSLLNFGSSCMYPRDYSSPLKEEYILAAPLEPTNEGYALGKIYAAKLCEYISKQYDRNYVTIIPPNLFGPGDNFDETSSHLIASVIRKLDAAVKAGEQTVVVWGDGSARREFLLVSDLAHFAVSVADRLADLPQYLNVGADEDHTVNEYYEIASGIVGFQGSFEHDLSRPAGMKRKFMDSTKAKALGWRPRTSLEDGIRQTYDEWKKWRDS